MAEPAEVLKPSFTMPCPWCDRRFDIHFTYKIDGKSKYTGDHHCLMPPMVDDHLLVTFERIPYANS